MKIKTKVLAGAKSTASVASAKTIADKSTVKTVAAKGGKVAVKQAATVTKVAEAKLLGERIAIISGAKGSVARLVSAYDNGSFKVLRDNGNKAIDGAMCAADSSKWDADARLQVGNYVCSRGRRAKVTLLTFEQANKQAKVAEFESRTNGAKFLTRYIGNASTQYVASLDSCVGGIWRKGHAFQVETEAHNLEAKKHFVSLVNDDVRTTEAKALYAAKLS